jgi:predicted dehydrogenase
VEAARLGGADRGQGGALRVGLAGVGAIAQPVHLRQLQRLPGARLVAFAEADPARLDAARRAAQAAAPFADYRQMLANAHLDAVVICLPSELHAAAAVAAFRAGLHVYLEKPVATSGPEASMVLDAWRASGRVGMVGFNFRFHPLYRAARAALRDGRLGPLVGACSAFASAARPRPDWYRSRPRGGGVLLDLASHHVDLARYLLAREVVDVSADIRSVVAEADTASLTLRLEGGLAVQSFFSHSAVDEDRFAVYGQQGKLSVNRYDGLRLDVRPPTPELAWSARALRGLRAVATLPALGRRLLAPTYEPSYVLALRQVVVAARANRPASPDIDDGARSLAVVLAAERSAALGRGVAPELLAAAHLSGVR